MKAQIPLYFFLIILIAPGFSATTLSIPGSGNVAGLTSFNVHVTCQPVLRAIEDLVSYNFSDYSVPDKRSLAPPCNVTLTNGTLRPALIELDNVYVISSGKQSDCASGSTVYCDYHINLSTQGFQTLNCINRGDPGCSHRILVETDQAWYQANYYSDQTGCNAMTTCAPAQDAVITIQGFVFWDTAHTGDSWHSFSGWELHPVIGWRPK